MDGSTTEPAPPSFLCSLVSGASAGLSVDVALYPIDTLKTRLQSPQGFRAAGGFQGVYNGLGAVGVGSAPGAGMFFVTYEQTKPYAKAATDALGLPPMFSHMLAASLGETAACIVRVPTEVVKTRMQTNAEGCATLGGAVREIMRESGGGAANLYRGFGITLMREIPFAFIQFPIYERMKQSLRESRGSEPLPVQSAACGSVGGAIAAALTTPLDVVKTRLMLGTDAKGVQYKSASDVLRRVVAEEGAGTLLNGIQPRVMWISIGGFVFFGAYESAKAVLTGLI
ncbi:hypothetical protein TeGR_g8776 [Tetraparma gracilis]|uniref:S-adenosylmethionine transporter n=1 Tax=Tetraparma gracilis TaxID=2962635 RepID=A0ABQ6MF46_9STRA|nr:hypothetical protein TeGR_g8776 [Tetraparma gracilis]